MPDHKHYASLAIHLRRPRRCNESESLVTVDRSNVIANHEQGAFTKRQVSQSNGKKPRDKPRTNSFFSSTGADRKPCQMAPAEFLVVLAEREQRVTFIAQNIRRHRTPMNILEKRSAGKGVGETRATPLKGRLLIDEPRLQSFDILRSGWLYVHPSKCRRSSDRRPG